MSKDKIVKREKRLFPIYTSEGVEMAEAVYSCKQTPDGLQYPDIIYELTPDQERRRKLWILSREMQYKHVQTEMFNLPLPEDSCLKLEHFVDVCVSEIHHLQEQVSILHTVCQELAHSLDNLGTLHKNLVEEVRELKAGQKWELDEIKF